MKKIIILVFLFGILSSCGDSEKTEEVDVELNSGMTKTGVIEDNTQIREVIPVKEEFNTIKINELSNLYNIEKGGKIITSDYINIKSEVSGNVEKILVKQGDNIKVDQNIIKLSDKKEVYYSKLESEEENLSNVERELEFKTIQLDNKIEFLEDELDVQKEEYSNKTRDIQLTLLKAEVEYERSKNSIGISDSNPKVLELDKEIDKLEYEYMDIVNANKNELFDYKIDIENNFKNTKLQLSSLINLSNSLFGESNFEYLIGAKDKTHKGKTKSLLSKLIIENIELSKNDFSELNEDNIINKAESIVSIYGVINNYINEFDLVLNDSISSAGLLEETDINNHLTSLNTIKTLVSNIESSHLTTIAKTKNFLVTYKNLETESYTRFDLLKKEREDFLETFYSGEEVIVNSYNDKIKEIEKGLDDYEAKIKEIEAKIQSAELEHAIIIDKLGKDFKKAESNYINTSNEILKFNISSPIDGIISSIEVKPGDKVGVNDILLRMSSKNQTEIKVTFNKNEFKDIKIGGKANIKHYDKTYEGIVLSKSEKTDENGNYYAIIVLNEVVKLSGSFVKVEFIFTSNKIVIPKDYIKITGKNTGTINILDTELNEKKIIKVLIGNVFKDYVEINSVLNKDGTISSLLGETEIIIEE